MEYKDIDRLFQEKLKDIEVTPNPKVWHAIEQKTQKKKRRILPFWWFSSGVAAVFIVSFFLFFNKNSKEKINDFPVITEENIKNETSFPSNKIEVVTKEEKNVRKETDKQEIVIPENQKRNLNLIDNSKVAEKENSNDSEDVIMERVASSDIITGKEKSNMIDSKINEKEKSNDSEDVIMKRIASSDDITQKEKPNTIDSKINEKEKSNDSEGVIMKGIASSDDITQKEKSNTIKKNFITETNTNTNNEFLKESTEKEKWGISPVVGILKSNSFSKTSPLDSRLNDNEFSGENTLAFGVNITYQIHKKWGFKSGIQLQKTGFTTNNVALNNSVSLVANSLENVVVDLNNNSSFTEIDNSLDLNSEQNNTDTEQGNLQQNYSYIEIPLEVTYTFFSSNNLNTSLVSGFSSLILNENNIVGESSSFNSTIGQATNLNTLNFSGNLGLDFDLKLSKKLNLHINPMFKTQLNTFSNNSNGFKPYNIGLYSGLKYTF